VKPIITAPVQPEPEYKPPVVASKPSISTKPVFAKPNMFAKKKKF
jgi:hypothetical protein